MGPALSAETAHQPTNTGVNAVAARRKDANRDLIRMASIAKAPPSPERRAGWNVDLRGQPTGYRAAEAATPQAPAEAA
jgi:hypothetical protein